MNLYKEGDRCYGKNFGTHHGYNFANCTIEKAFKNIKFDDNTEGPGYSVIWDDKKDGPLDCLILGENHLKLRRSVVERSSWGKIKKICGIDVTRGQHK